MQARRYYSTLIPMYDLCFTTIEKKNNNNNNKYVDLIGRDIGGVIRRQTIDFIALCKGVLRVRVYRLHAIKHNFASSA